MKILRPLAYHIAGLLIAASAFSSPALADEAYPEWKVKLAYTLIAKAKEVEPQDPGLAKDYYSRAQSIYPESRKVASLKPDAGYSKAQDPKSEKNYIQDEAEIQAVQSIQQQPHVQSEDVVALEPQIKLIEKEELYQKQEPVLTKTEGTGYYQAGEFPECAIVAKFESIDAQEVYSAEKRGPTITTILDPYYIDHKNFRIPYFKDREGLKLHPWLGIRGEYVYDEQRVALESLIMEAKEFDQRRNDQIRDYISMNKKELYRQEVLLHIREWLPKFTFINHREKVKRVYEAKRLWSSNDTYYDNYDRKQYLLEHTIPNLKKLGYLKLKLRYGDELSYRTNDQAAHLPHESYMAGFETSPHISGLGRVKIRFEYEYWNGEYKRAAEQGWSEREAYARKYLLEFELYNQEKFLRIMPHFSWKKEQHSPSHDTWWTKNPGLKIQKNINGKLMYTTDWNYVDYIRLQNPSTPSGRKISASCWTWENEVEYEIVTDLKLTMGLDYGKGLGFNGFDNTKWRSEMMFRTLGLIDLRLGYRYTEYLNVNDNIDTVYFKLGLFI
ncbi:MAG: hypothetical protein PHQ54_01015 [Candidatus Omnitrophica bacterium]|nr:hypothetical protein [Candidatus Omnitrophota bacterium]